MVGAVRVMGMVVIMVCGGRYCDGCGGDSDWHRGGGDDDDGG